MSQKEYIPGDTVFAKLKGYPWWPARVENDKDIPAKILKQKGKSKGVQYTVFFYGSRDYGFFGPDCVRPFDRATVERDLKAKKFKTKDLELAIHQALDPSILKAQEEAEAAALAAQEEEEEEEEEEEAEEGLEDDEEEEEEVKPKRKERKKSAAIADKKKKQPAPTKKRANPTKRVIQEEESEEEEEEEVKDEDEDMEKGNNKNKVNTKKATSSSSTPASTTTTNEKNKRTRLADGDSENSNDRKKRRKSLSTEQEEERNHRESSTMSRNKSEEPSNSNSVATTSTGQQMDVESFKKTTKYKKVYQIRHKLQKLVYEKKPGEIKKEDYSKISHVVKEIEDAEMTYDLLRYTKIGKVVKFACTYEYEGDEFKISQRCQQLMKNWKSLIVPETPRSSSVTASGTSAATSASGAATGATENNTSSNNNQQQA